MAQFHHTEMSDLAKQMTYSPAKVRLEQVARAEKLACLITPGKAYPYEFVCYQITGYRPRADIGRNLAGKTLREDLIRLVENVSASMRMRADEASEPVLSIAAASKHFNVSEKTIQRWRKRGLVSRKFLGSDGRLRVGFLQSSLERFATRNAEQVRAGAEFSRLTPDERREIIRRARRLSLFCHCCLFEVSKRIAANSAAPSKPFARPSRNTTASTRKRRSSRAPANRFRTRTASGSSSRTSAA